MAWNDGITDVLIFSLHGDDYAICADLVEEIIQTPPETVLPVRSSGMISIINHKSEIFTTVSLFSCLYGMRALDDKSRLSMICEFGDDSNGLIKRFAFKIPENPPYLEMSGFVCEKIPQSTQFNKRYIKGVLYKKADGDSAKPILFIDLVSLIGEVLDV